MHAVVLHRLADDFAVEASNPAGDLVLWRACCARGDEVIGAASADDVEGKGLTLRATLLSLLHEYQRHSGHLDIVRELVDGSSGL